MPTAPRSTIRFGSKGPDVTRWQTIIGVTADGAFGPGTEAATKAWQAARGLVADGIVGQKCWEAAGETFAHVDPIISRGWVNPSAPACLAALRSANAAWPGRKRISDGIMGDARHMAGTSDHNVGNAVDITHDPDAGCDGNIIAELAIKDPRSTYVIWNARIYSKARAAEGWRPYSGANAHRHHCHISVAADKRGDASPWEWERLYGPGAAA